MVAFKVQDRDMILHLVTTKEFWIWRFKVVSQRILRIYKGGLKGSRYQRKIVSCVI